MSDKIKVAVRRNHKAIEKELERQAALNHALRVTCARCGFVMSHGSIKYYLSCPWCGEEFIRRKP